MSTPGTTAVSTGDAAVDEALAPVRALAPDATDLDADLAVLARADEVLRARLRATAP